MTQIGGFWDGTTTGQAALAPYDALEFNGFFSRTIASHGAGFVIPGYLNDLKIRAPGGSAIIEILSGAAYVKGFHFSSDATETFTIAANASGNPRIDRIVLRATWATKEIVLAMIAGTPAASPSPAPLTQIDGTTWEVSLGYIWVANGFVTIADDEVHDERVFAHTFEGARLSDPYTSNLIINSEFMAFSGAFFGTELPEYWAVFGTLPTMASATKPAQMSRGRYAQMTAGGANRGIAQTVRVLPSTPYSFRVLMNVTAGDVGAINITTNSGAPVGLTRTIRRTGIDLEETLYYTTEADATTLTIAGYCVNNTDVVKLGQVLAVPGYYPGPWREVSEMLVFRGNVSDVTNWTFANAKSDGTNVIDLDNAVWGSNILPGTRAINILLEARDAGSAAQAFTACWFGASEVGVTHGGQGFECPVLLRLGGIANDVVRNTQGWVNLNNLNQFELVVQASGAGTLDSQPRITAIHT